MKLSNDCVIVACPPYPEYKEYPKDQSHSELTDCPRCSSKMWLSQKKKGVLAFSSCLHKEIILACYDCIRKLAEENPSLFRSSKQVDL